jgi:RNA polymerase sigma-70 factor (ECF subfamily)
MSFFSESVLSWPIPAPTDVAERTPSSPEVEVVKLFGELRGRLLRYLLALGLSAHDGEEIIQESFLLLFQHLQRGKPRHNLRGWIFRVTRNLALKRRTADQSRAKLTVEFDEALPGQSPDQGSNPEEQLHRKRRQKQLLAVMRALPELDQSCLCLRADGLRYREIAQVLGISLGSVAGSLARSLEKLTRADKG